MHIVFLSNEFPIWTPGGLGTFLQTFGRTLSKNQHQVTILGIGETYERVELNDEQIKIIRLPKKKGVIPSFLYNSIALNKELKKIQIESPIDIIETPEMGLALISRRHPAKKVIRLHGGHHFFAEAEKRGINRRKGLLEKRSFRKADGFIAVSNYVKQHTEKFLSYHNRPVEVINNMVDTAVEIPMVEILENHILFAGTICEKKGVRQLLEAFLLVRKKYPEMILDLYGRDWFFSNGNSYIEMLQKLYDASYFENVIFHGSIPRKELDRKYAEARLCVFPSHMETQGLVTLEAMLLKKPVVFSKYGPGPETVTHEKTGLLCDVYDPGDIAAKIIWYLEHPELAEQIGSNAQKHVRATYDKNTILAQNITFYNQLITHA